MEEVVRNLEEKSDLKPSDLTYFSINSNWYNNFSYLLIELQETITVYQRIHLKCFISMYILRTLLFHKIE